MSAGGYTQFCWLPTLRFSAARIRTARCNRAALGASGNVAVSAGKSATVPLAEPTYRATRRTKSMPCHNDGSGNASAVTSLAVRRNR